MTFGTIRKSLYSSVVVLGIAIVIPAYADNNLEKQVSEGIKLAGGGEVGLAEYFVTEHKWPAQFSDVYTAAGEKPAGKYVAFLSGKGKGETYAIQAVMRRDMYVLQALKGKSLVIWTTDGGNTWHCGTTGVLGISGTISRMLLPKSCRE